MPFLSFIEPIFAWNVSLLSLIFLKTSLSFPFYCFPLALCTDHWRRLSYLSLLILGNSAFKWVYLPFSPLLFTSLLFTAICKASSNSHFALLHFFFLGMALISVSCTMSRTSVHSSSAIKRNTFESVLMRWMNLEPIIQSEVSQKEKDKYHILTYIYGI